MNETTIGAQSFFWIIHTFANIGRSSALFQLTVIIFINIFQMFYVGKRMNFRRNYRFVIFNTVSDVIMSSVMIISFYFKSCIVLNYNCEKKEKVNLCEFKDNSSKNLNHTLSFLSNSAIMSSTWAIVIISCDRLRAIKYPLKGKRNGLLRNTRMIIGMIVLVIVLTNISRYWESNIVLKNQINITSKSSDNKFIKNNEYLRITFMSIRIFIHILLPSLILIVTNIMLINNIKSRKITFEKVKWNLISKSFEAETQINQKRNKFWSLFLPCKNNFKENRITTNIILMISIHIISFTPTTIYNIYFEIIIPISKIYFNTNLPYWNATLLYDNQFEFKLRKDLAYIPIFIFFIGKMANAFLMSNLTNFILKNYKKIFLWKLLYKRKNSDINIDKKNTSEIQRKVTKVYYSNAKQFNDNEIVNVELCSYKTTQYKKNYKLI
ncbi:G protein-coupled receptor, rhodopsin-like family and GPCR, rhodopsin-like, 7TM domain-containing protein [Strongyloides ratti]|uniref:G protein-coupled receptor, rhodopsin-like family and GPCR, rhodopsin-like, 7TM domain-containing protein n=1 Tax=Strongyloides ratti TaxID=34506 RepID=A0A090KUI1_STRRB|nr:G protein-coupled receptor, rhodopsin-like family and GPCR, rhodopsin-like, 7TM domain-containing protein [Strongyloides ratti]CEF61076.1 G protein-coupled receptor, rhodopsin-like family and GPCR, rhodopsin-like, 7TM domain-containing protein [Strongyloides ratti]